MEPDKTEEQLSKDLFYDVEAILKTDSIKLAGYGLTKNGFSTKRTATWRTGNMTITLEVTDTKTFRPTS